jgi:hypothetical protein
MLSTKQLLKIDPSLSDLSEVELEELRNTLYSFAQLAFDVYWTKKMGSKNPIGHLPPPEKHGNI